MLLKLLFCAAIISAAAIAQDWNAVQNIARDTQIKVRTAAGDVNGSFTSASAGSISVRTESGERAVPRNEVKQVKVRSHSRRSRNGVIATAIGAGAGIGIGVAICPGCKGEGKTYKFVGPLLAVGTGAGALVGFAPHAYQTVYKAPRP